MNNYVPFHMHTQLSLLDSCTKYKEYIDKAQLCGMKAFAFSEHGNLFEWYHKKCAIEDAGMKYIHAIECYVTEGLDEKRRDNYHCVLLARNYDGFLELNRLISKSFNRQDGHYYYKPRITFEELTHTSDNIIMSSACIASIASKGGDELKKKYIDWIIQNRDRCFIEIQHHNTEPQKEYNKWLYDLCNKYDLRPIAGTDTHALDEREAIGRDMLLKSKGIEFDDNEAGWDLTFKTYDELVEAYQKQDALSMQFVYQAIDNTNELAEMVEPFTLSKESKYPKIFNHPVDEFKKEIQEGYKNNTYVRKRYSPEKIKQVVNDELAVYEKTGSIDFMLLQNYLRHWERDNGIQCGYSRGSVSGSEIAYILGVTQMDSLKFNLNFFRFMNPNRVTNPDIDSDYANDDRNRVKTFLLHDHMGLDKIQCAEIITFNTIALKGAIRDVCRGLYSDKGTDYYTELADAIVELAESDENEARKKYEEVFKYVDILNGTVVSVGSHPSGVLITDTDIASNIGLCSIATSDYPVSMINMKELDALMYLKLDILGLDNIGIINDCCKLLGIERLTPDNVDLEDEKVWESIRDDTTLIFQWESESAQNYLRKFMSDETLKVAKSINPNFSYIKWFSFGNGLIRPGCASFRDSVANGEVVTTGFKELDDFLAITMGHVTMQEDIMMFLVKFCGYSDAESDTVRRGIAKKYGTEKFIDEIHRRFVSYSSETYGVDFRKLEEVFPPIKQALIDASGYAFSWNHSDSYSCLGYICGYLRYYYPKAFLTAALNIFVDKEEKTLNITQYAQKVGIDIVSPKFRHSTGQYMMDEDKDVIYKGIGSIKYLNTAVADELYTLRNNEYATFIDALPDITATSIDARQLTILIKIGFFEEFGEPNALLKQYELYQTIMKRKTYKKSEIESGKCQIPEFLISAHAGKVSEKQYTQIDQMGLLKDLVSHIELPKTTVFDRMDYELEVLDYITTTIPDYDPRFCYILNIDGKFKKKYVTLYQIRTGKTATKKFEIKSPIKIGDIICIDEISNKHKWRKTGVDANDKPTFERLDETEQVVTGYRVTRPAKNT